MKLPHGLRRLLDRKYDQDAKAAERAFADAKAEVDAKWAKRAETLASALAESKAALLKSERPKQEIDDAIAAMEAVAAAMTLQNRKPLNARAQEIAEGLIAEAKKSPDLFGGYSDDHDMMRQHMWARQMEDWLASHPTASHEEKMAAILELAHAVRARTPRA